MNYIGLNTCDTANGEGVRVSLFVSGCTLHCKDCFNKESWDFKAGNKFTKETLDTIINALGEPYVKGFSLLGGDPFEHEHQGTLLNLLATIKDVYPDKDIWCWTGRVLRDIKDSPLLPYIDVLIDGAFVKTLYDASLKWRGSSNQRIIYLKEIKE